MSGLDLQKPCDAVWTSGLAQGWYCLTHDEDLGDTCDEPLKCGVGVTTGVPKTVRIRGTEYQIVLVPLLDTEDDQ